MLDVFARFFGWLGDVFRWLIGPLLLLTAIASVLAWRAARNANKSIESVRATVNDINHIVSRKMEEFTT